MLHLTLYINTSVFSAFQSCAILVFIEFHYPWITQFLPSWQSTRSWKAFPVFKDFFKSLCIKNT